MKNYTDFAVQKLKQTGLKITKPRKMIVELLAQSDKALSPYEMREILKKNKINADVVTIYRVLEALEGIGIAHKVLAFNGYVRCNTDDNNIDQTFCHHYLLCKICHRVEEVTGENLHKVEEKISQEHQFEIESHYLEFMGLCKNCKTK